MWSIAEINTWRSCAAGIGCVEDRVCRGAGGIWTWEETICMMFLFETTRIIAARRWVAGLNAVRRGTPPPPASVKLRSVAAVMSGSLTCAKKRGGNTYAYCVPHKGGCCASSHLLLYLLVIIRAYVFFCVMLERGWHAMRRAAVSACKGNAFPVVVVVQHEGNQRYSSA